MTNEHQESIQLLRELVKWTRVGFYSQVKTLLTSVLTDEKRRLIYSLADGNRTTEEIRKQANMSPNKVTELFRTWEGLGIMQTNSNGRRTAQFDLAQFDLAPKPQERSGELGDE